MPRRRRCDRSTCAVSLKGRFKGAKAGVRPPQWAMRGRRATKRNFARYQAMEAGKTRAGPRREPSNNGDRDRDRDRRVQFALSVSDPKPVMEVAQIWRTAAQSATIGIFIILFVVALSLARPILLPVASAFVVTMMLGPLS